ncbi:MAG: hypothetical protein J2P41_07460 [Blastocatellia bacterium]|nr:hypothetical protein [Blastocatellia bacterium]
MNCCGLCGGVWRYGCEGSDCLDCVGGLCSGLAGGGGTLGALGGVVGLRGPSPCLADGGGTFGVRSGLFLIGTNSARSSTGGSAGLCWGGLVRRMYSSFVIRNSVSFGQY